MMTIAPEVGGLYVKSDKSAKKLETEKTVSQKADAGASHRSK
jgi:hypothetical protein